MQKAALLDLRTKMSKFLSKKYAGLVPYTPGEQPQNRKYIKLNTNESPFPPSEKAVAAAFEEAKRLQLYSDPECGMLKAKLAQVLDVSERQIIFTNGSDDILNFAFMAFCDGGAAFPDITYGFYSVFADFNHIAAEQIPLKDDFTIDVSDYAGIGKTVFIANPNAPTGIALTAGEIETIVKSNPDNVVVIDEAYVDFGAESCIPLIKKYDNLLVTQTFSKSRSMAGARLGFAVGSEELIRDLDTIRYSTNPYNINRMTMAAGVGVLQDEGYTRANCRTIQENREWTENELKRLGFECLPSKANFLFARHPGYNGKKLYDDLKEKGILIRHFEKDRIREFNRVSIGTREQMQAFIFAVEELL